MLGALAGATQATRIGPAVTYAFDPAAHHPSWLAKRAVSVDHLSGGRLDVRLAVGAEDAITTAWWKSHGIAYPAAPERIAILEETVAVVRRAAALDRGLGTTSVGGVGGPYRGPPRRWAAVVLMPQAEAARRARDNIAFARAHRASVTLSGVTMLVAVATRAGRRQTDVEGGGGAAAAPVTSKSTRTRSATAEAGS